jgi:hypothetical protein
LYVKVDRWRVGRTAIATVLKTVARKGLGVRVPHPPPTSSLFEKPPAP